MHTTEEAHEYILRNTGGQLKGCELTFSCPSHSHDDGVDTHPSFSYNVQKRVGRCLSCGFSGGAVAIAKAMGWQGEVNPLTLEEYSRRKALPIEFLRALGLKQTRRGIAMPYLDELGQTLAVHTRHRWNTGPNGEPRFTWRRGDKVQPYGLWRLEEARRAGWIIVTESTSDAQTCWFQGVPAVGMPGAKAWRPQWASYLRDIPVIFPWEEPGDALAELRQHLPPKLNRLPNDKLLCLVEWTIRVARDRQATEQRVNRRDDEYMDSDEIPFRRVHVVVLMGCQLISVKGVGRTKER